MKNANTKLTISKKFSFSAAHKLSGCSEECGRVHGHNYSLIVFVSGERNECGIIFDLKEFSSMFKEKIIKHLDHMLLNDVLKDINPSLENLSYWIWDRVNKFIHEMNLGEITLEKIVIHETDTCSATIERLN